MTIFNELLEEHGIDPVDVAVLRHHTPARGANFENLAQLWREDLAGFALYQNTQRANRPIFRKRPIWASFVCPTPHETLFIGLFDAKLSATEVVDWICPYRGEQPGKGHPVDLFDTELRPELSELVGKMKVDWPRSNVRSWKRKAERIELPIHSGSGAISKGTQIYGDELVAALEVLGFNVRISTSKTVQLRRGDLIVYVKRNTLTQPLVIHPRYIDFADDLDAISGVNITSPPRVYKNAHLREFPEYVAPHRASIGRYGFALSITDTNLAVVVSLLVKASCIDTAEGEVRVVAPADTPLTEKERLQAARVGQGDFRNALIVAWDGTCPVAGVDHLSLLRASHIKPWKDASNAQRLDPFNGLLLCAHVDALFDRGLISFADDGKILISRSLTKQNLARLRIAPTTRISGLDIRHAPYLEFHRENCFVQ